jgi:hypothetical protein
MTLDYSDRYVRPIAFGHKTAELLSHDAGAVNRTLDHSLVEGVRLFLVYPRWPLSMRETVDRTHFRTLPRSAPVMLARMRYSRTS